MSTKVSILNWLENFASAFKCPCRTGVEMTDEVMEEIFVAVGIRLFSLGEASDINEVTKEIKTYYKYARPKDDKTLNLDAITWESSKDLLLEVLMIYSVSEYCCGQTDNFKLILEMDEENLLERIKRYNRAATTGSQTPYFCVECEKRDNTIEIMRTVTDDVVRINQEKKKLEEFMQILQGENKDLKERLDMALSGHLNSIAPPHSIQGSNGSIQGGGTNGGYHRSTNSVASNSSAGNSVANSLRSTYTIDEAPKIEDADREALEQGILLSKQDAKFGTNMNDSLRAEDEQMIEEYIMQGYKRSEATLMIFEERFGAIGKEGNYSPHRNPYPSMQGHDGQAYPERGGHGHGHVRSQTLPTMPNLFRVGLGSVGPQCSGSNNFGAIGSRQQGAVSLQSSPQQMLIRRSGYTHQDDNATILSGRSRDSYASSGGSYKGPNSVGGYSGDRSAGGQSVPRAGPYMDMIDGHASNSLMQQTSNDTSPLQRGRSIFDNRDINIIYDQHTEQNHVFNQQAFAASRNELSLSSSSGSPSGAEKLRQLRLGREPPFNMNDGVSYQRQEPPLHRSHRQKANEFLSKSRGEGTHDLSPLEVTPPRVKVVSSGPSPYNAPLVSSHSKDKKSRNQMQFDAYIRGDNSSSKLQPQESDNRPPPPPSAHHKTGSKDMAQSVLQADLSMGGLSMNSFSDDEQFELTQLMKKHMYTMEKAIEVYFKTKR